MTNMQPDHERLDVWQRAMDLVVAAYAIARLFPKDEQYVLGAQIRRAAISVPANIAEGSARGTPRERLWFLAVSRGSLSELETHFAIAKRLGYASEERLAGAFSLSSRTGRLLNGLRRHVSAKVRTVRGTGPRSRVPGPDV